MADTTTTMQWEPIPIVLGVVGHRDVAKGDEEKLTAAIAQEIEHFQKAYPGTPIVVLTSLAQGADILAAEAAVRCGCKIRAALPMPEDHFLESSSFDDDKREVLKEKVKSFLALPTTYSFAVPMPESMGQPPAGWEMARKGNEGTPSETYRQQAYAVSGQYLVSHCDVLIALWDGEHADPKKPSGTAEHIAYQTDGIPQQMLPKDLVEPLGFYGERKPVVVFHTPRSSKPTTSSWSVAERRVLVPPAIIYGEKGEVAFPQREATFGVDAGNVSLATDQGSWATRWKEKAFAFIGSKELIAMGRGFWHIIKWCWGYVILLSQYLMWNINKRNTEDLPKVHTASSENIDKIRRELRLAQSRYSAIHNFNMNVRDHLTSEISNSEKMNRKYQKLMQQKHIWNYWKKDIEGKIDSFDTPEHLTLELVKLPHREASSLNQFMDRLLIQRRLAGSISRKQDDYSNTDRVAVFLALLVSQGLFHWYSHVEYDIAYISAGLVIFCVALFALGCSKYRGSHTRRLDARAFAEALRVRIWWGYTGISRLVGQTYLQQTRSEVSWIRQALLSLSPPSAFWKSDFDRLEPAVQLQRIQETRKQWVLGQVSQHFKNQSKEHHRAAFWRLGGLLVAVVVGILPTVYLLWHAEHPNHYLLWLMGTALIAGGLMIGYAEQNAHEELAKQYERLHKVFCVGMRELDAAIERQDIPACQAILIKLGEEALAENAQWLIIRRNRPVDLHVG